MGRWFVSLLLMAGLLCFFLFLARATPHELWSPEGTAIVLGGSLIYVLSAFGYGECVGAVKLAWSQRPAADEEWIAADHLFECAMRSVVAFGAIGYITGLVLILKGLDDPKMLGPRIAVALLSVFNAVVVGELILGTLRMRTQRVLRAKQVGSGGSPPGPGAYVAAFMIPTLPILACFLVI